MRDDEWQRKNLEFLRDRRLEKAVFWLIVSIATAVLGGLVLLFGRMW